jgi:hypothetical protein
LLPWLHSTEANEHIFGILRQLKPDSTNADFLYYHSKMRTLLIAAFNDVLDEQQANCTAAGYLHSYFISKDLDLNALSSWPSAQELELASE